jgi:hypothetical protein
VVLGELAPALLVDVDAADAVSVEGGGAVVALQVRRCLCLNTGFCLLGEREADSGEQGAACPEKCDGKGRPDGDGYPREVRNCPDHLLLCVILFVFHGLIE